LNRRRKKGRRKFSMAVKILLVTTHAFCAVTC
jgi:hypothetical protein